MKTLVYVVVCGALGLVVTSNQLPAQTATGAEARLRERNITLPPVPSPVANYGFCACRKVALSRRKYSGG